MFSVGDVVELKSGGPRMTVVELDTGGHMITQWFEASNLRQGGFLPTTLRKCADGASTLTVPNYGIV